MQMFGICAGVASILSLAFALWQYNRHRILAAREEGNIHVLTERLNNIRVTTRVALNNLQLVIRRADDTATPVGELQNMARMVRGTLIGAYIEANDLNEQLREWKFGEHLKSARTEEQEELFRQQEGDNGGREAKMEVPDDDESEATTSKDE